MESAFPDPDVVEQRLVVKFTDDLGLDGFAPGEHHLSIVKENLNHINFKLWVTVVSVLGRKKPSFASGLFLKQSFISCGPFGELALEPWACWPGISLLFCSRHKKDAQKRSREILRVLSSQPSGSLTKRVRVIGSSNLAAFMSRSFNCPSETRSRTPIEIGNSPIKLLVPSELILAKVEDKEKQTEDYTSGGAKQIASLLQ
ncbi:hypothetical protein VNO78_24837 [Psophocarpus tetragonolobus]|uniref:Uncharacterized protein n=1 Tax=Psophocarpus tetragonolobus TaxID=3891 RepID=A0AAN9S5H7_PSOTE